MEDMSKKTKRLEKENETLKRKHEATNANIIRMAEEREDWKKKAEAEKKNVDKLRSIIQQMQQQGRKMPPGLSNTADNGYSGSQAELDGDDSDYSEDDDGEELSGYEEDDTEEEPQSGPATSYGPEPPPPVKTARATNGN
jgi:chromosome segregation ATPase